MNSATFQFHQVAKVEESQNERLADRELRTHVLVALFWGFSNGQAIMIETMAAIKAHGLISQQERLVQLDIASGEFRTPHLKNVEEIGKLFLFGSELEASTKLYFKVGELVLRILRVSISKEFIATLGEAIYTISGNFQKRAAFERKLGKHFLT